VRVATEMCIRTNKYVLHQISFSYRFITLLGAATVSEVLLDAKISDEVAEFCRGPLIEFLLKSKPVCRVRVIRVIALTSCLCIRVMRPELGLISGYSGLLGY
jgi:hypothetical protein